MAWDQLVGILEEARTLDREEAARAPEDCPVDGTPLVDAGNGVLFCTFDGWQYPRDAR